MLPETKMYEAYVAAETKALEELRLAEVERARRIDEALANGETLDLPPVDLEARASANLTRPGRK